MEPAAGRPQDIVISFMTAVTFPATAVTFPAMVVTFPATVVTFSAMVIVQVVAPAPAEAVISGHPVAGIKKKQVVGGNDVDNIVYLCRCRKL